MPGVFATGLVCAAAFGASALTLFSGFGLGTLLMPALALFFPVPTAIALTAIVHLANNLFKLAIYGRYADRELLLRFGLPAVLAALPGAALLRWLSRLEPLAVYRAFGGPHELMPVELAAGLLLGAFAVFELRPPAPAARSPRALALGGALSGFFGGLSGHQGALRSLFLSRTGVDKQAFIGTGVAIACLVDLARLAGYGRAPYSQAAGHASLLGFAAASAFAGVWLGGRFLRKMTMRGVQRAVTAMLAVIALGLSTGLL